MAKGKAIKLALADTKRFHNWDKKTIIRWPLTLFGLLLYWLWRGDAAVKEQIFATLAIILGPTVLVIAWYVYSAFYRLPKSEVTPSYDDNRKNAFLKVKNIGKRPAKFSATMLRLIEVTGRGEKVISGEYPIKWSNGFGEIELKPSTKHDLYTEAKLLIAQLDGIAFIPKLEEVRAEFSIFPLQKDRKQIEQGIALDSRIMCELELKVNPSTSKPQVYKYGIQLEGGKDGKDPQWKEFIEVKRNDM